MRTAGLPAVGDAEGESIPYRKLFDEIEELTRQLTDLGLGAGQRVVLAMPRGIAYPIALLALTERQVCAPFNDECTQAEFRDYLDLLRPSAVVVGPDSNELKAAAEAAGAMVIEFAWSARTQPRGGRFELVAPGRRLSDADLQSRGLVLPTSGTTGQPKLVPLTQSNLASSADAVARTLQLRATDKCLGVMPMFHIHGIVACLVATLRTGGCLISAPKTPSLEIAALLSRCRPTWYSAVPTIHQGVLASDIDTRIQDSLRFIRSSSSALGRSIQAELEEVFRVPVIEAYGMTEAAHQICSNPLPPGIRRPGTVGRPAGAEVRIVDDSERIAEPGEVGEITIQGPGVTSGYLREESDEQIPPNAWFRTGDLGSQDEDGYLTIVGRIREMINRGGETIAPREIDDVLLSHPQVVDAIAFAVPHERLGEEVAAVVVGRSSDLKPEAISAHTRRFLSEAKVPKTILIVDDIPKGPSGKPERVRMSEIVERGL